MTFALLGVFDQTSERLVDTEVYRRMTIHIEFEE
jgi:hypothetical protein